MKKPGSSFHHLPKVLLNIVRGKNIVWTKDIAAGTRPLNFAYTRLGSERDAKTGRNQTSGSLSTTAKDFMTNDQDLNDIAMTKSLSWLTGTAPASRAQEEISGLTKNCVP